MSDFNYVEYLRNNPLLKKENTQSSKLITESQEDTIDSLQKSADDTSRMPADRDKDRQEMYMKKAKMTKSELREKIREEILSALNEEEEMEDMPLDEAKKDEEEEAPEEEMAPEVDMDMPAEESAPASGLSAEEQEIQNSLKIAYDNATAIGDQKLADQIGNSITFFTRTHIVER
jgi:hypothetical protein